MNLLPLFLGSSVSTSFRQVLPPVLIGAFIVVGVLLVYLYLTHRHYQLPDRQRWLFRCIYATFLFSLLILSITSFGSVLRFGTMQHYALILHVAAAGAFVVLLLPVAGIYLPRNLRSKTPWWIETSSAWTLILSSLIAAAAMLISMLPAVNTEGLIQLTQLHRYAGLVAAVSGMAHVFSLGIRRFGIR